VFDLLLHFMNMSRSHILLEKSEWMSVSLVSALVIHPLSMTYDEITCQMELLQVTDKQKIETAEHRALCIPLCGQLLL